MRKCQYLKVLLPDGVCIVHIRPILSELLSRLDICNIPIHAKKKRVFFLIFFFFFNLSDNLEIVAVLQFRIHL